MKCPQCIGEFAICYTSGHPAHGSKPSNHPGHAEPMGVFVFGSSNGGAPRRQNRRELYRIFFYDCPPLEKKLHNPVSKRAVDFAKSDEAVFRLSLHQRLLSKRKLALRLGHLSTDTPWTIKPRVIADLLSGKTTMAALGSDDVMPAVRQKGVDMRIGVDVASLAFKKQVDQIVLIAGDADFVPAAKLARREGIDFVLDPMWRSIPQSLMEHIDGLRSTCPKPQRASDIQPVIANL